MADSQLSRVGQGARNHFLVYPVGNAQLSLRADQAQVSHVLDVIFDQLFGLRLTGQNRLDHLSDPFLLQFIHQLVQVRLAAQDQPFLRFDHHPGRDRRRAFPAWLHLEADLVSQSVDQPGLAVGQFPGQFQRRLLESLPGLLGVLPVQRFHISLVKVAQAQRLGLDVERAAAGDDGFVTAGMDAIVAHVAYSAQDDALWKRRRTPGIAGAQLA